MDESMRCGFLTFRRMSPVSFFFPRVFQAPTTTRVLKRCDVVRRRARRGAKEGTNDRDDDGKDGDDGARVARATRGGNS
jgi:hypothetical protein